jgi:hypothetical protein
MQCQLQQGASRREQYNRRAMRNEHEQSISSRCCLFGDKRQRTTTRRFYSLQKAQHNSGRQKASHSPHLTHSHNKKQAKYYEDIKMKQRSRRSEF